MNLDDSKIILIDKPKGITSFDCIRILRKKLSIRKMGHAGTLDPLATGLMIIGIEEGTKKMSEYIGLPKTYEADILLGVKTDTGDMEGKILEEKSILEIDENEVLKVLNSMVGKIKLLVPIYSAIKQKGVPLYKKARRGEKVVPPEKEMEIKSIKLISILKDKNHYILKTEMAVGSGAYIRSIVEEIGKRLNLPATVKELRRTKIGDFDIKDSTDLFKNEAKRND